MRHGLPLGEVTIGQEFQALGYNTGWVGKWHLGMWAEEALPWRRGFNRTYGFVSAGGETYTTKIAGEGGADEFFDLRDQGSIVTNATEIATYNTELFAAKAAQFIEDSVTQGNDPFFLYYAMQNVHAPVEYPDKYFSNTPCKDVVNENRGKYCALLRAADAGIATVMDTLRRLGVDDDTIVVLSSDNGGAPSYGGYNTPLKGSKGTTWEGGVRAVAAVWAPGHLPAAAAGTVYEGVVHVTDWMPTLLRRAGWSRQAECNTAKPLDGVDVWPAIVENVTSPRTEVIHYYDPEEGGTRSLRSGRYKLVVNASDNRGDQWTSPPATVNTPGTPSTGASGLMRLFDVEEDATETTNLWDTLPSVRDTMLARLEEIGSTVQCVGVGCVWLCEWLCEWLCWCVHVCARVCVPLSLSLRGCMRRCVSLHKHSLTPPPHLLHPPLLPLPTDCAGHVCLHLLRRLCLCACCHCRWCMDILGRLL